MPLVILFSLISMFIFLYVFDIITLDYFLFDDSFFPRLSPPLSLALSVFTCMCVENHLYTYNMFSKFYLENGFLRHSQRISCSTRRILGNISSRQNLSDHETFFLFRAIVKFYSYLNLNFIFLFFLFGSVDF